MVKTYFLGGNTAQGFYSLYDGFCSGPEDFLWVIKGGPGCGKSSFMRKIGKAAEEAGLDVEYVICSGDPDSLDGVYIPALHTGYVDGTSPHVVEVKLPAAGGAYLDLGQFYDTDALQPVREQLLSLMQSYRQAYRDAYASLHEAKRLHDELEAVYNPHVDFDGVYQLAEAHIARLKLKNLHCNSEENVVE